MSLSSKEWLELPEEVVMGVTVEYARRLVDMALKTTRWSPPELTNAVKKGRIVFGHDYDGIYMYCDRKPIAGALYPKLSKAVIDDESIVFIKGSSAESIPAIEDCLARIKM